MGAFDPFLVSELVKPWSPENLVDFQLNVRKNGHGPGEFKFVEEMRLLNQECVALGGQNRSWDVMYSGSDDKYELKDITTTKGEIRLGEPAEDVSFDIRSDLVYVARDLKGDSPSQGDVAPSDVQEVFARAYRKIRKGEICKSLVLELYEKLQVYHSASQNNPRGLSGDWLNKLWNEKTDPAAIFSHVKGLIVVHETAGYAIIPRDKINIYVHPIRITQGKIRMKLIPKPQEDEVDTYLNGPDVECDGGVGQELRPPEPEPDRDSSGEERPPGCGRGPEPDGGVGGPTEVH